MRHPALCTLLLCALTSPTFASTNDAPEMGSIEIVNFTDAEMHLFRTDHISDIFADSNGSQLIPGIVIAPGQSEHLYVRPVPLRTPTVTFGASNGKECMIAALDTPASRPQPSPRPVSYLASPLTTRAHCVAEPAQRSPGVTWAAKLTIR